jgi:hypothetical protein
MGVPASSARMASRKDAASAWGKAGPVASTKSWVRRLVPGELRPSGAEHLDRHARCVDTLSDSNSPGPLREAHDRG